MNKYIKKQYIKSILSVLLFFFISLFIFTINKNVFAVVSVDSIISEEEPLIKGEGYSEDYIDDNFWNTEPSNDDIIRKIFGENASNRTKYTENRSKNECDPLKIKVQYLEPGKYTIPSSLSANTLYVLSSGSYITKSSVNLNKCSGLIGRGIVTLYPEKNLGNGVGLIYANNIKNSIIDNIKVNGKYSNGNNISMDYGIYYYYSDNNTINNVDIQYSKYYGIYVYYSKYNNILNSQIHHNNSYGLYLSTYSSYNNIYNINIYSNASNGLYLYSRCDNNTIGYIKSYLNKSSGIQIYYYSNNNILSNIRSYSNTSNGIYIYNRSTNNTINNSKVFNNTSNGITISNSSSYWNPNYTTINNTQSYNNGGYGISISYSDSNLLNNVISYNNKLHGVSLSYIRSIILNKNSSYNNGSVGINLSNVTGKYYDTLNIFSNNDNRIGKGLTPATDGYMGFPNGYLNNNGTMGCEYADNPQDTNTVRLLTSEFCDLKGNNKQRSGTSNLYFYVGENIPHQSKGIYYENGVLKESLAEYDPELPVGDIGNDFIYGADNIYLTNTNISKGKSLKFTKKKALVYDSIDSNNTLSVENVSSIQVDSNTSRDGKIKSPEVLDTKDSESAQESDPGIPDKAIIIQTIEVGSETASLSAQGGTFEINSILLPGVSSGQEITLYRSSDNGSTWTLNSPDSTCIIDSLNQCSFKTDHLSNFTFLGAGASFFINNDSQSTNSNEVTLNISAVGAQRMRFANDILSGRSSWESYSNTKSWTLSTGYGTKTVYIQFDANNDGISDGDDSDSIELLSGEGGGQGTQCAGGGQCGQLTLEITSAGGGCSIGNSLDFGQTLFSFDSKDITGYFLTTSGENSRYCEDLAGLSYRNVTIQTTNLLNMTTQNPNHTINSSNIFLRTPIAYKAQGNCTAAPGASLGDWISIGSVKTLFGKIGNIGEVCKVQTDNVEVKVSLGVSQAVGIYSGTLTIDIPNF